MTVLQGEIEVRRPSSVHRRLQGDDILERVQVPHVPVEETAEQVRPVACGGPPPLKYRPQPVGHIVDPQPSEIDITEQSAHRVIGPHRSLRGNDAALWRTSMSGP